MRKFLQAIFVLACLCAFPKPAPAVHLSPQAEQGEAIFQKTCSTCHTVGGGRSAGPDLAGVTERRDRAWLIRMIITPGALLDGGDPAARRLLEEFRGLRMPDLGVSPEEADAILAYLAAGTGSSGPFAPEPRASTGKPPQSPGEASAPETGDPETGRALFSGMARFANGGAACAACHAIAGMPGGSNTLGPNLSQTYADYGEEGITPVLAAFPFPSMKPIYDVRPLTRGEQAHIKAFLRISAEGKPAEEKGGFLALGLGGFLIGMGVAHIVWRRRLSEVRCPLLRRAAGRGKG